MATIIIDVDITAEDATDKAKSLASSIKAIKEEQKGLKASSQENSAAYAQNAQMLRALQAEQKSYLQLSQSEIGSNNQLRAQLAILTQQYNAMGREERELTENGRSLTTQIRAISDELRVNESAVGDNRRNVGNYKDALGSLGGQMGGVVGQIQEFGDTLGSLKGLLKNGETGAYSFGKALLATGIGAIIALVAILINYLKEFDPLLDFIEQIFAGLKGGLEAVGRVITSFVTSITSVGDLLSKIGNFLKNPIAGFKSLAKEIGDAAKASYDLKKAQQDLEDSMKAQEVANAKAEQQIQQLILQSKNRALSEKERQSLLKQAAKLDEDTFNQRTKLVDEELKQANEAARIRGGLSKAEQDRLKREGTAYAIKLQNDGKLTEENVDNIKKAELSKIGILQESTNRQEKIQNRNDQLAEQAEKKAEQYAEKQKKRNEERKAADEELLASQRAVFAISASDRVNELNAINQDIDARVETYRKYGRTVEQLEKERVARLNEANKKFREEDEASAKEFNKLVVDETNKNIQLQIDAMADGSQKRLAQQAFNQQQELRAIDKQIADAKQLFIEGDDAQLELITLFQERRKEKLIQGAEERLEIDQQYADMALQKANEQAVMEAEARLALSGTEAEQLEARQLLLDAKYQQDIDNANRTGEDVTLINAQYSEAQKQLTTDQYQAASEAFNQFGNVFQDVLGKNTVAAKIAAELQAKANAATMLQNNIIIIQEQIKALTKQGGLPFPANLVAIFSTLAALGSAISAAKTIISVPKFADGTIGFNSDGMGSMVRGSGTSRSDSINARLSNGESVINARSTKMFAPLLSALNIAGGGRSLSPGFAMADGGIATGGYTANVSDGLASQSDLINGIVAGFRLAPAPILDVRAVTTEQQRNENVTVNKTI